MGKNHRMDCTTVTNDNDIEEVADEMDIEFDGKTDAMTVCIGGVE